MKLLCFFILLSLALGGCAPTMHTRGNFTDLNQVKKIKVGETTRADVHMVLGPPSTQELFTGTAWYYIGEQTTTRAFFKPDLMARHVVIIEFDATDKVSAVHVKEEGWQEISPISEVTPTYGKDPSVLTEVFGNIGRYSESQKEKKKI